MLRMVPSSSEPFDLGFVAMLSLHRVLSASPELNTFLAFLNTGIIIERIQAEPVEGKRKFIYLGDGAQVWKRSSQINTKTK
nr:phosphatidylcholine:diacylglycerol cholinephosphotransferase 1 [Quercus suber]